MLTVFCAVADCLSWSIEVSNNGPVVYGANITFHAVLKGPLLTNFSVDWIWEDNADPPHVAKLSNALECDLTRTYDKPGTYKMTVTAKFYVFRIASAESKFKISAVIPGSIEVFQGGEVVPRGKYVNSANDTNIRTKLYDPTNFFSKAYIYHMWYLDSERLPSESGPNLTHVFPPGDTKVLVVVTAYHPSLGYREGSFSVLVKSREPIEFINVTGNTMLTRGDILDIEVECGGSSPWSYCWRPVLHLNETNDGISCSDVMTTNDCTFRIIYLFPQAGRYKVFVNISNDVNRKEKMIDVSIFNVLPEPQLSTVLLPVVCSMLAVGIIVAGVFYFIQARHRLTVEVADFDFTSSDSLTYRTFCEQLKDAFANALPSANTGMFQRGWNFLDCRVDPEGETSSQTEEIEHHSPTPEIKPTNRETPSLADKMPHQQ